MPPQDLSWQLQNGCLKILRQTTYWITKVPSMSVLCISANPTTDKSSCLIQVNKLELLECVSLFLNLTRRKCRVSKNKTQQENEVSLHDNLLRRKINIQLFHFASTLNFHIFKVIKYKITQTSFSQDTAPNSSTATQVSSVTSFVCILFCEEQILMEQCF